MVVPRYRFSTPPIGGDGRGLVIEVLVLEGTPVSDEQSMWIVLRPRDVLDLTGGDDASLQITAASLYQLRAIVGELPRLLVEMDAVTDDSTDSRGRDDI
jgi:hypothetical protein